MSWCVQGLLLTSGCLSITDHEFNNGSVLTVRDGRLGAVRGRGFKSTEDAPGLNGGSILPQSSHCKQKPDSLRPQSPTRRR